jgi:hypothetical protein
MQHRSEKVSDLQHDLIQRIRKACCDDTTRGDEHAVRIAREVARAREAREKLMHRRASE